MSYCPSWDRPKPIAPCCLMEHMNLLPPSSIRGTRLQLQNHPTKTPATCIYLAKHHPIKHTNVNILLFSVRLQDSFFLFLSRVDVLILRTNGHSTPFQVTWGFTWNAEHTRKRKYNNTTHSTLQTWEGGESKCRVGLHLQDASSSSKRNGSTIYTHRVSAFLIKNSRHALEPPTPSSSLLADHIFPRLPSMCVCVYNNNDRIIRASTQMLFSFVLVVFLILLFARSFDNNWRMTEMTFWVRERKKNKNSIYSRRLRDFQNGTRCGEKEGNFQIFSAIY